MSSSDTLIIETPKNATELTFGRRVACIIENSGLSKAWVAERLGISKQALNYLLKDAIKPKFVDELAEILGLNAEWIEKGSGSPWGSKKSQVTSSSQQIPVLTKKDLLKKRIGSWESNTTIDIAGMYLENFIAYKLEDDSSFPPFIRNSILIFNIEKQPQSEDYVLLLMENDVFVRQFLVDGNIICYKSSNPGYKTFINPDGIQLLGVLTEARYQVN